MNIVNSRNQVQPKFLKGEDSKMNSHGTTFGNLLHRTIANSSNSRPPKMELTGTLIPHVTNVQGQKFKYKLQTKFNSYFLTFSDALTAFAKSNEWNEVVVRGTFDFDLYAVVVDDIRRLRDRGPTHGSDLWAC